MKVYFPYTSYATGGEPESDDRWASRSPEYRDVTFLGKAYSSPDKMGRYYSYEDVEIDEPLEKGKPIFLVIVTYSDGDTFGATYGNVKAIGASQDIEKATALKDGIEARGKANSYEHPWDSYFGSMEMVDIEVCFFVG